MEQSEQLFTSAANAGYASRPLLLFYGISQAGRAIAAASVKAGEKEWDLAKHGITADVDGRYRRLANLGLHDTKGGGSFIGLASLLSSSTLGQGVPLGKIWCTIPELRPFPLESSNQPLHPFLGFSLQGPGERISDGEFRIYGWLDGVSKRFLRDDEERKVCEFISHYPTLTGAQEAGNQLRKVTQSFSEGECARISRVWVLKSPPENVQEWSQSLTTPYAGDERRYVFPALDGSDKPIHPLIAWWALLFSLSMLARYKPAKWTEFIDVDRSPDAASVEHALDCALHVCPELVHHTIRAVSSRRDP
ncbi:hypothetical protein KBY47_21860 [Streptomyces sp. B93]|nr:hypothetical protein [Streptomyces sp. B93]